MKEEYFFYNPAVADGGDLPEEEAHHAVRVLRLSTGDSFKQMDGKGHFYDCVTTAVTKSKCSYQVVAVEEQQRQWTGHLHLAIAPTKNIDRMEWLVEKATEIGFDELTFLDCKFSERHQMKLERIERILVAAMKQSRKPFKPVCNGMRPFSDFVQELQTAETERYICHCYGDDNAVQLGAKLRLRDCLAASQSQRAVVMVGPEGDFSIDEVAQAEACGFQSVGLGHSRLRTETAGLVAVHLMHLFAEQ